MTPAPGDVFAGFIIERELGAGGMGVVFLARHPRLPRRVALKLLRTDLGSDPLFVQRFQREAETVARLDHPNIVSIDDSGAQDGQLWISMRFIDGATASEALTGYAAGMPPERAVHIIEKVAAALDFAHRHCVVHRDVKPANILLTNDPDEREERVYLTDFGVAKAMGEIEAQSTSLTTAGGVVATLDYAAPEQIEAKPLDGRCDVFALGCVLYKLLTGVIPYPGDNLGAKVYARMHQPPPAPSSLAPTLPGGFDAVIATALAREPDDRYQTCRALAVAARAALTAAPVRQTSTVRIPPPDPDATQFLFDGPPPVGPDIDRPHTEPPPHTDRRHTAPPRPAPPSDGLVTAATAPPSGYSSPASLPPNLAKLLGPGMIPVAAPSGPDHPAPHPAARRRRTRRRSVTAMGAVILVATVVIGVGLLHRSQVAGSPNVQNHASTAGPSAPRTTPAELVDGLPHSIPLPATALVVSRQYGKNFALYLIDTTTGKVGKRISPESDHGQNPLLSRQRGSVVYVQGDATGNTIRTVAADGSGDRSLFARPAGCSSIGRPAWDQADPRLLAINCGLEGGPVTLQIVDLTGRVVRTLSTGLAIVDDLSFSPDGAAVLYWGSMNHQAGDGGLYVQSVDGSSAPKPVTPADSHDADCVFSPDGKQITFRRVVTDRSGSQARIAIVDASGSAPATVLLEAGQGPIFSPDGRQIAYKGSAPTAGGKRKSEILVLTVVSPDQPRLMAIGDNGTATGSPIWGPR